MRDLLKNVSFDAAWCSDLRRARETATIILESRRIELRESAAYSAPRAAPSTQIISARHSALIAAAIGGPASGSKSR